VSAVVVVLLMRGRSGLGRRLRFGGLIAWHGRRIKHHAIELDRLLGMRLKWRTITPREKARTARRFIAVLRFCARCLCTRLKRKNRKFPKEWQGTFA